MLNIVVFMMLFVLFVYLDSSEHSGCDWYWPAAHYNSYLLLEEEQEVGHRDSLVSLNIFFYHCQLIGAEQ